MAGEELARQEASQAWRRYAEVLSRSMAEVRGEVPDDAHAALMETADYWLAVGIFIGRDHADAASRLLEVIEADRAEREELRADASHFIDEALE